MSATFNAQFWPITARSKTQVLHQKLVSDGVLMLHVSHNVSKSKPKYANYVMSEYIFHENCTVQLNAISQACNLKDGCFSHISLEVV